MKNIVLIILSLVVFYIVSIFVFPRLQLQISNALRLQDFDSFIVEQKQKLDDFVNSNILDNVNNVTNSALEIKQNIETQVETFSSWVQNVWNKLDEVRDNINKTSDSINSTLNSIWELKESVSNVIPTSSWTTNQAKIEELTRKIQEQKTSIGEVQN